jgi:serine/threonine protein kinase
MRSTDTYSAWFAARSHRGDTPRSELGSAHGPVRLTYVEDQMRWGRWARPGSTLAGRYELEAPLTSHAPGTFWQARCTSTGARAQLARAEQVTVQLLDAGLVEAVGSRQAFLEEARAAATIEHAHVARVLDYGIHAERGHEVPFLVLEHLVGQTLEDLLAAQPRLAADEFARWMTEAARGLDALHGWGLVHRRIDPAHWFLAREPGSKLCGDTSHPGRVRTKLLCAIDDVLGDHLSLVSKLSHQLGYSRRVESEASNEGSRRPATREYQSPEQLLGHDGIDERSDLWSLAVIAFEALTGTAAFSGNTTGERLVQICSGEPNAVPVDVMLPEGFAGWFQKGVQKLPAERFASARELADALRRVLDPQTPRRH